VSDKSSTDLILILYIKSLSPLLADQIMKPMFSEFGGTDLLLVMMSLLVMKVLSSGTIKTENSSFPLTLLMVMNSSLKIHLQMVLIMDSVLF